MVPVQTRPGRAGSRRLVRAGGERLPRKSLEGLAPGPGGAAGDALTASLQQGLWAGGSQQASLGTPARPGNGHKGGALGFG